MPPDDLTPIEPAEIVHELCDRLDDVLRAVAPRAFTAHMELHAFRETRTPHDGKRLANALRYNDMPDLAEQVERLLFMAGDQWTEQERARMQAREATTGINRITKP